ncbi:DUF2510 domain-containing protein [Streptomyces sp. NPDC088354]|uniref:DUF2510 domain-containing protein n=1 Tax=unclassified Streptomyces TaxID=2593676 RepID=UPI0029BF8D8E|nr:DUF2510 domain-containing protein [Streptomyces sp. MI02-7b]MDX3075169.1 DUF2510 domain-containing protein [Streptomyces sp. MI02-7b]
MTTPPGWYPEPGQTGNGPALERWWDGSDWTEYTRGAQVPAPAFGAGAPGYPQYPAGFPAAPRKRRGALVAIAVVAAVVVAGAVVGGVAALTRGSDSGADSARPGPSVTAPGPDRGGNGPDGGFGGGPGDGPSNVPKSDPGFALDAVDGISLPVPDGWTGGTSRYGLAQLTVGEYTCPGDASNTCVRGGVFSMPAASVQLKSTTAEAAAKEDIAGNAEESYGGKIYGGITSHTKLLSQKVTVAGRQGYLVRWKVVTKKGDDGYVQSLVFPSPSDPAKLVLIRSGFDINDKAPKLAVMDEIVQGIKAAGSGGGTGI